MDPDEMESLHHQYMEMKEAFEARYPDEEDRLKRLRNLANEGYEFAKIWHLRMSVARRRKSRARRG